MHKHLELYEKRSTDSRVTKFAAFTTVLFFSHPQHATTTTSAPSDTDYNNGCLHSVQNVYAVLMSKHCLVEPHKHHEKKKKKNRLFVVPQFSRFKNCLSEWLEISNTRLLIAILQLADIPFFMLLAPGFLPSGRFELEDLLNMYGTWTLIHCHCSKQAETMISRVSAYTNSLGTQMAAIVTRARQS